MRSVSKWKRTHLSALLFNILSYSIQFFFIQILIHRHGLSHILFKSFVVDEVVLKYVKH